MSDLPGFKKFVSEDELAEQKKKRQEEWEKVRKPDDPIEAPEEVYDPRSLYERLQEQKDKKQSEFEESIKLKNQVKGLESDEVEFLDFVSDRQTEIEKARELENETVLAEYRNAVVSQAPGSSTTSPKPVAGTSQSSQKKSQSALLAGAVKRKGSEADAGDTKKSKRVDDIPDTSSDDEADPKTAQVIGILPGMGAYSGTSSESDTSSGDDDSDLDLNSLQPSKKRSCSNHKH